jgi:hypothetical protein
VVQKPIKLALVTLFVILGTIFNVFAETQNEQAVVALCIQRANILGNITDMRDEKVSKKDLLESLDTSKLDEPTLKEFLDEVNIIYTKPKDTPEAIAQSYFGRCLIKFKVGTGV